MGSSFSRFFFITFSVACVPSGAQIFCYPDAFYFCWALDIVFLIGALVVLYIGTVLTNIT